MPPAYEIRPARGLKRLLGQCYVALVASNGEVLSTSEILNRKDTALANIEAQKSASQSAVTKDRTV